MKRKSIGAVLLFLIFHTTLQAQNDRFNWGFGYLGSAYSYSAVLENKVTSPYKYNTGQQIALTRYLSHNFDIELTAGEAQVGYLTGGENGVYSYTPTQLYDGAIHLKYKFDNGYIIKEENYRVSPFLMAGAGASYVELTDAMDLMVPVGMGLSAQMGKRLSFVYQSSFRYNVQAANAYWAHGIGLKYNFGKIGIKRITATRERERERKLERIAKRDAEREKRRLALEAARRQREEIAAQPTHDAFNNPTLTEEPTPAIASNDAPNAMTEVVTLAPSPAPIQAQTKNANTRDLVLPKPILPPSAFEPQQAPAQQLAKAAPTPAPQAVSPDPLPLPAPTPLPTDAPTTPADDYCSNSLNELAGLGRQIVFKYGSAYINSDMITALQSVVEVMERCPSTSYAIMAHTDASGDAQSNMRLSEKRGIAIRNYLIQNGVQAERLVILPCGEYAASGDKNAADRSITFKINRRISN